MVRPSVHAAHAAQKELSSLSSRCGHKRMLCAQAVATGAGKAIMTHHRLVNALLALRASARYHPEKHYMRGPGPKTLSKLGAMYRAESAPELRERVPDEWVDLLQSIKDQERDH